MFHQPTGTDGQRGGDVLTDGDDFFDDAPTPLLSMFSRLLSKEDTGSRRMCGECGYWIEEDEPRYRIIRVFPEIEEAEDPNYGVGSAPFSICTSCYGIMNDEGQFLIEPKEENP